MSGFNMQNLFSALSGVSSGGTNNPYTPSSNANTATQGPNMNGPGVTSGGGNQGVWPGNMTSPQQTGQNPMQGQGIMGMFKDIMGRAPAIYQAMQSRPNVPPMQGFMNGMNMGMRR